MYRKKITKELLKAASAVLTAVLMCCPCTIAFGLEADMESSVLTTVAYTEAGTVFDGLVNVELSPIRSMGQMATFAETLPAANTAVQAAHRRIGLPYSQARRDSGYAVDCSSLVYWAYLEAGVNIDPTGPHTAASIAQYLEGAGKSISADELKPGDLVFYSFKQNGRYKNISHVAIVAEDGLSIQASSGHGMVIIGPTDLAGVVAFARPAMGMDEAVLDDAVVQSTDNETEEPGGQGTSLGVMDASALDILTAPGPLAEAGSFP